ncbi:MAG: SCO family protein [Chitinophagaceae bacterium]|nr:SCO family protein [Chitinophagaceae bacterium]
MNKKAFLAVALALMIPLVSYLLVKYYSERAVTMPSRYFYDSVATHVTNGRSSTDTVWHHLKNISFTNQLGDSVSLFDLKGKILVIDFFFTRCPTLCPGLARSMKKLQNSFKQNDSIVQFISISVDPLHDSVSQLRKFAARFNVDPDSWWLVTGAKKDIYDFALNELKAGIADVDVDTGFVHTPYFFLVDKEKIVRGWYNGGDSVAQSKLVRDIPLLMLEKDRKKTFGQFLKELFGRS